MKIGDLSRQFDVPVETIRYYEREKLLPVPERTEGNYRIYGAAHADRLRFILNCRALDMTLDEIRALLTYHDNPTAECSQVNELLEEHIGHVAERISELQRLERQLRQLRRACRSGTATGNCGILKELKGGRPVSRGAGHVHARTRGR